MHSEYLYPNVHDDIVLDFCNKCDDLNYMNNNSFESMKWYWGEVRWVGTFIDDVLVSLSGIHKFPEIDENSFRMMFRGASLPGVKVPLNIRTTPVRRHSNKDGSFKLFVNFQQMPLQQKWAYEQNENATFYVTFNIDPMISTGAYSKVGDKSKNMIRAVRRHCKNIGYHGKMNIYNVEQEVYVLL
jgi:hypothetical protein|tara:strand:+ start:1864 stop:2418 length:555 start_codon:yes stop_codon:yes gene_type:complete